MSTKRKFKKPPFRKVVKLQGYLTLTPDDLDASEFKFHQLTLSCGHKLTIKPAKNPADRRRCRECYTTQKLP